MTDALNSKSKKNLYGGKRRQTYFNHANIPTQTEIDSEIDQQEVEGRISNQRVAEIDQEYERAEVAVKTPVYKIKKFTRVSKPFYKNKSQNSLLSPKSNFSQKQQVSNQSLGEFRVSKSNLDQYERQFQEIGHSRFESESNLNENDVSGLFKPTLYRSYQDFPSANTIDHTRNKIENRYTPDQRYSVDAGYQNLTSRDKLTLDLAQDKKLPTFSTHGNTTKNSMRSSLNFGSQTNLRQRDLEDSLTCLLPNISKVSQFQKTLGGMQADAIIKPRQVAINGGKFVSSMKDNKFHNQFQNDIIRDQMATKISNKISLDPAFQVQCKRRERFEDEMEKRREHKILRRKMRQSGEQMQMVIQEHEQQYNDGNNPYIDEKEAEEFNKEINQFENLTLHNKQSILERNQGKIFYNDFTTRF